MEKLTQEFMHNLWRWKCSLSEYDLDPVPKDKHTTIDELYKTEWCEEFEQLCRNRLLIGGMRYGRMHSTEHPIYNYYKFIASRLEEYHETGNLDSLVDVANGAMLLYVLGDRPDRYFDGDSRGIHDEAIR